MCWARIPTENNAARDGHVSGCCVCEAVCPQASQDTGQFNMVMRILISYSSLIHLNRKVSVEHFNLNGKSNPPHYHQQWL